MPIITNFSDTHSTKKLISWIPEISFFGLCVAVFPFLEIIILAALLFGPNYGNSIDKFDFGRIPNQARLGLSQATLKLGSARLEVAHNEPGSAILIEPSRLEVLAR